jgi:hypothetical protein
MDTIAVDKLMEETRRLAKLFREKTGSPLPVSQELGRYDAAKYLQLQALTPPIKGVDFVGSQGAFADKRIQVKSRVIFDEFKKGQRIGQLNIQEAWDYVVLVLYNDHYHPFAMYGLSHQDITELLQNTPPTRQSRGIMSLAKFKSVSELLWTPEFGMECIALKS